MKIPKERQAQKSLRTYIKHVGNHAKHGMVKCTLLFLAFLLISSCTPPRETIKAGVIAPLTGDFASYGIAMRNGIEIAKDEINFKGGIQGRPVEVFFEDACLPKDSLTSADTLVNAKDVDFISGVFCIIGVNPIATVTEKANMSLMVTAAVPDSVLISGGYIFSTNVAIKNEASAQADFAIDNLHSKTAGVVFIDSDFGISFKNGFVKRFQERGGIVLLQDKIDFAGVDFRSQLTKVKEKNPDVLLAVHLGNQMGILLEQAKELGIKARIIGTYEAEDPAVLSIAKDSAEGFIISTHQSKDNPTKEWFVKEYERRFHDPPALVASNAYDALILQTRAYAHCNGDRVCIKEKLKSSLNYEGASGVFSILPDHTSDKAIMFKIVENGAFHSISILENH